MRGFLKKLNEPFPDSDSPRQNLIHILSIGVFVTLFIYIFNSGGIHNSQGNVFLNCVPFGIITILCALFFDFFIEKILKIDRTRSSWTFKKWILSMFGLLFLISLGNYSYFIYLTSLEESSLYEFMMIMVNTITIGLFPIIVSGLMIQINANKKNQIQAADLQPHLPTEKIQEKIICLSSNNKSEDLTLAVQDIFYLEAMQNYVSVCYQKDGQIKKDLLRNTIKNIELEVKESPLIRCHRSFVVNTELIEKVEGNAQGLRLSLKSLEEVIIPVSRKYIPILKEIIRG